MGFFNLSTPLTYCFFSILANFVALVEVVSMGATELGGMGATELGGMGAWGHGSLGVIPNPMRTNHI
jgi:hypothetical protein